MTAIEPFERPKKKAPKKLVTDKQVSAMDVRRVRKFVRQTASLVSTQGPIKEVLGPMWAAELDTRTIIWRLTTQTDPPKIIDDETCLGLIVHEAGHLNYTGGWKTPSRIDKKRFHRFVNAIEDIRIERLSELEFPGFGPIRKRMNQEAAADWTTDELSGLHIVDLAGMMYLFKEDGLPLRGDPDLAKFVDRTWPEVTRIANATNTADMADMLIPIYDELMRADKARQDAKQMEQRVKHHQKMGTSTDEMIEQLKEKREEGKPDPEKIGGFQSQKDEDGEETGEPKKGCMSQKGADNPTNMPVKSPMDEIQGRKASTLNELDFIEMLAQMADDAGDPKTALKLREWARKEQAEQQAAKKIAEMACGQEAGFGPTPKPPPNPNGASEWDAAKTRMRGHINALARKLEATLKNNAADDWETGMRKGQLDLGLAPSSLTGNMNVFRTRTEVGAIDYTFGFIVDVSASQRGRALPLLDASVLVAEACERAGVNWFMLPWDHEPHGFKRTRHQLIDHKGHLGASIRWPRGNTYEAPALIMVEDEFKRIRSGHRFLITITDGQTTRKDESMEMIQELHKLNVKALAIAVAYHQPPTHYDHSWAVDTAEELSTLLPRILSEVMRKGGR